MQHFIRYTILQENYVIYVNGDSWSRNLWIEWSPEDWSWPKQFSDRNTVKILNQSAGCGSNSRILSCLQDVALDDFKIELVIIAMTTPFRWHLPAPNMSVYNIGHHFIKHDKFDYVLDNSVSNWCLKHNVFDELEMTYRYFVSMWQMKSICDHHLKCPVLFFNAWDQKIGLIDKMILDPQRHHEFIKWVETRFVKTPGFSKTQYIDAFLSIGEKRKNWLFFSEPWTDFLNSSHYDGPNDRDPNHPSKQGHTLISHYVESKIIECFPGIIDKMRC